MSILFTRGVVEEIFSLYFVLFEMSDLRLYSDLMSSKPTHYLVDYDAYKHCAIHLRQKVAANEVMIVWTFFITGIGILMQGGDGI